MQYKIEHEFDPEFYHSCEGKCDRLLRHFTHEPHLSIDRTIHDLPQNSILCYASRHLSHEDYVELGVQFSYLSHDQGIIRVPRIIGGSNLMLPVLERDLRRLGTIPINRELMASDAGYRRAFVRYFQEEVIGKGEHTLVFPEAGRSYSGRLEEFNTFFFNIYLHAQRRSSQPIYIVPVAITYDRVVEDAAFTQLKNAKEAKRSVRERRSRGLAFTLEFAAAQAMYYGSDLLAFAINYFFEPEGDIYIDLGSPIPVSEFDSKEYLASTTRDAVGRLVRVTPTSLAATVLHERSGIDRDCLELSVAELRDSVLDRQLLVSRDLKHKTSREIVNSAVRHLNHPLHRVVAASDGRIFPERMDVIEYYKNTIAHLL
jgi:glycerol-3-phosphate O-acyltransferase